MNGHSDASASFDSLEWSNVSSNDYGFPVAAGLKKDVSLDSIAFVEIDRNI